MNSEISFERLIEITDGEPLLMKKLLSILLKNLQEFPLEIEKAFLAGKDKEMRELAHKFKSSVAYLELNNFDRNLIGVESSLEDGLSNEQKQDLISTIKRDSIEVILIIEQKISSL
jgi:HPt (histidine-containing phosphotransfer) domain-containing protein